LKESVLSPQSSVLSPQSSGVSPQDKLLGWSGETRYEEWRFDKFFIFSLASQIDDVDAKIGIIPILESNERLRRRLEFRSQSSGVSPQEIEAFQQLNAII
jgi:hypothetical protein